MNDVAHNRPARLGAPRSLRFVALLEAAKGGVVLLAGLGLFELLHHDIQQMAEELVRHFHLNPASHYPRIFIDSASRINDGNLRLLAGAALAYAMVRALEAYGLWHQQRWAEWFGAVGGAIYIPVEIYELLHGASWPKALVLAINVLCVAFLARALLPHPEGPSGDS